MADVRGSVPVSVVVPCRNVAGLLRRSLESVFAALPDGSEVVAVDDGSTDSTGEALMQWAASHPALRVIRQPRGGVSSARNRALDVCTRDFVFFVDPDDAVEPDYFGAMTSAMLRDGADYCLAGFYIHDGGGAVREWLPREKYSLTSNAEIRRSYLPRIFGYTFDDVRAWYRGTPLFSRRELAQVWRAAFRRDVLERFHVRFDESMELNEDALFNAEYLLHADSMTTVRRPLYHSYERADGAQSSIRADAVRLCRSRIAQHLAKRRLDDAQGGALYPLYAGSCVLSALDTLSLAVRLRLSPGKCLASLREYFSDDVARRALAGFPLSWRRPFVAAAVFFLRCLFGRRRREREMKSEERRAKND